MPETRADLVLPRLRSGLSTHLGGLSFERQGAFAADTGSNVRLDFGSGNIVVVEGVANVSGQLDDINFSNGSVHPPWAPFALCQAVQSSGVSRSQSA